MKFQPTSESGGKYAPVSTRDRDNSEGASGQEYGLSLGDMEGGGGGGTSSALREAFSGDCDQDL